MNWLNIHTSELRSPAFIGSDPVARATWLYVTAYCCEQENGGRIIGCRSWKDRQWQQTCGVTLAELEAASPLIKWDGEDVLVAAYPREKEDEIKAKRKAGGEGGKKRAKNAKLAARENPKQQSISSTPRSTPSSRASTEGEGEGKENGKGKEGEREDARADFGEENNDPAGKAPTRAEWIAMLDRFSVPAWYADLKYDIYDAKDWASGRTPIRWSKLGSWVKKDYLQDGSPTSPDQLRRVNGTAPEKHDPLKGIKMV